MKYFSKSTQPPPPPQKKVLDYKVILIRQKRIKIETIRYICVHTINLIKTIWFHLDHTSIKYI